MITLGSMVGENTVAGPVSSIDVVLTADVALGDPTTASWLIVAFSGVSASDDVFVTAITDNAPVGAPYFIGNALEGGWGVTFTPDHPAGVYFHAYLLLNTLHIGDVVTITANRSATWLGARLHAVTGLAAPTPEGAGDETIPNPPFGPTGPFRQGGISAQRRDEFPPSLTPGIDPAWVSDLTVFYGGLQYAGSPPAETFQDSVASPVYTKAEQYAFEAPTSPLTHIFYAFDVFADGVTQELAPFNWRPQAALGAGFRDAIGYGIFKPGPGIPYPLAGPSGRTGCYIAPFFVPLGNQPAPV